MLRISGPESCPREGRGPRFRIEGDEPTFVSLEVAVRPDLLAPDRRRNVGATGGFHGTWMEGPLKPPGESMLPLQVWRSLRSAPRIWYRAIASQQRDAWINISTTVPDERVNEAPYVTILDVTHGSGINSEQLDQIWLAALSSFEFCENSRADDATGAVVRHATTPRRPASSSAVTWLVYVTSHMSTGVREVVAHVRHREMTVEMTESFDSPHHSSENHDLSFVRVSDSRLDTALTQRRDLWENLGPISVWQDLSPPPTEGIGGTVIVSNLSNKLLYAATTSWANGETVEI